MNKEVKASLYFLDGSVGPLPEALTIQCWQYNILRQLPKHKCSNNLPRSQGFRYRKSDRVKSV